MSIKCWMLFGELKLWIRMLRLQAVHIKPPRREFAWRTSRIVGYVVFAPGCITHGFPCKSKCLKLPWDGFEKEVPKSNCSNWLLARSNVLSFGHSKRIQNRGSTSCSWTWDKTSNFKEQVCMLCTRTSTSMPSNVSFLLDWMIDLVLLIVGHLSRVSIQQAFDLTWE
jgi:hypothetical protein